MNRKYEIYQLLPEQGAYAKLIYETKFDSLEEAEEWVNYSGQFSEHKFTILTVYSS